MFCLFVDLPQTNGPYHRGAQIKTRAHRWLVMAHYRVGVSTINTERSKTLYQHPNYNCIHS